MRAAVVEVNSNDSGRLSATDLIRVFSLAGIPLALHQTISIHRHLAKASSSSEVSVTALLKALSLL